MARKKRSSKVLDNADKRHSAVKSIDAKYDLGNGINAESYQATMDVVHTVLNEYNTMLSKLDELGNKVKSSEKNLREFSEKVLGAVGIKYGKDSNEYEMAGGVRKSERKKPTRKTTKKDA